jgi:PAS domain S-box-containing protein
MEAKPDVGASVRGELRWKAFVAVGLGAVFAIDASVPEGVDVALLYPPLVLAAAWLGKPRATAVIAAVASALTLLDLAVVHPWTVDPPWTSGANRGLTVALIWATVVLATWGVRAERRRSQAERSLASVREDLQRTEVRGAEFRTLAVTLSRDVTQRNEALALTQVGMERMSQLRDRAVHDLERNEALMRAVLDNAAEAILTIDGEGRIQSFNRAAERIFGWTAAEVLGRNVSLLMPEPDRSSHDEYLRRYLRTRVPSIIGIGREVRGLRKDGRTFPLDLSVSEVRVGAEHRFTGILRDLTERQRLEDQLRHAQKMEAVGRLASGVAHEFNNLLMGILGVAGVARRKLEPHTEGATLLGEIRDAAQRGASLSRHLLDYSRQDPGVVEPVSLNEVVRRSERVLRHVIGEDVRVEVALSPGPATVLAVAPQLEQVLMNLAVNARDAMPRGGVLRIATAAVELDAPRRSRGRDLAPGRYVALTIEDSGCGMAPEVQERVFEPFFTTKPVGTGTGLGLYTVYGIVERLRGAIEFESHVGRGTKFTIFLPRAEERVAAAAPSADREPRAAREAAGTILLVEDERLIRITLERQLAELGYATLAAADAEEALRIAGGHAGKIDLVLTDVVLPGMTGPQLVAQLAKSRPGLRSLVMSAHPAAVLVAQGRVPQGTRTLEKPFDEDVLAVAIREVIEDRVAAG